jgi:hypothetical protein
MHCWPLPRTTFKRSFRCSREPWGRCLHDGVPDPAPPTLTGDLHLCEFPAWLLGARLESCGPVQAVQRGDNDARRRVAAIGALVRRPSPSGAIFSPRLCTPSIIAGVGRHASNSNGGADTHWNAAPWGRPLSAGPSFRGGQGRAAISFVCGCRLHVFPSALPTPIATWVRWQNRPFHWIAC